METLTGNQLAQEVRQQLDEFKKVCAGVDENTANSAPSGRWSPKEIISHLIGPKTSAYLSLLKIFLDKDNPTLDLDPGNPFFSEERAKRPFYDLQGEVEKGFEEIASFAESLTAEQLARCAHVPKFKESPLGENPSLGAMLRGLGVYHLQSHTEQLSDVLKSVAGSD